jgi:glycosyltransferase involved in cell wall biosynthesis
VKILHLIPSIAPVRGGPSQAIIQMVCALREQEIDAEIATTNDNGPDLLEVPLHQRTIYQDVPVWFFPRFSPSIHSIREFAFSSALTHWLWQNLDQYNLLHVHAIFSYPSTIGMMIARIKNIPYINRPLGQLCTWSLQQSQRKKQIYLNLVERSNVNHAQRLHFTTEQEKQEASTLELEASSFILPHGITLPPFKPKAHHQLRENLNLSADEPIILFMSRLHEKKGLEYLIPALGKLKEKRFTFVLAGNGTPEYETHITQLIQAAKITNRTYRSGFISGEQKTLFLQGSDLFVLTSHSENFGVAVLEAMAAGLPVLITPGVALASVVRQHQLGYITDLDTQMIASQLQSCLENPTQLERLRDRAREFILKHYTWEQIAGQLIEIYTAICEKKALK